jgi:hypothetical protein
MNKFTTVLILAILFIGFQGCKKDILLQPNPGELVQVFDRGDIQQVAATNHKCFFTQRNDELVVYQYWDSSFTFFNDINAGFGSVNHLELVADDTVVFAEVGKGLRYFTNDDIRFFSKNLFPTQHFDRSCQLIGASNQTSAIFQFPGSPAPSGVFRHDIFRYTVLSVAACNNLAYIGTEKQGVQVFENTNKLSFAYNTNNTSLTSNVILDLTFDKDALWILTPNELAFVQDNKLSVMEQPRGTKNKSMFVRNGIILVNTSDGIHLPENGELKPYAYINQQLPYLDQVNDISASPDGRIWLGTKKGLYCYRP